MNTVNETSDSVKAGNCLYFMSNYGIFKKDLASWN